MESFLREKVLGKEECFLPADTYNEMHLLLQRSGKSCLFIPVRSMQYMAVLDHEEVIFVDARRKRYIEFSWCEFKSQDRASLTDPVSYSFEYYHPQALESVKRMHGEFVRCIHVLFERYKQRLPKEGDIIEFRNKHE